MTKMTQTMSRAPMSNSPIKNMIIPRPMSHIHYTTQANNNWFPTTLMRTSVITITIARNNRTKKCQWTTQCKQIAFCKTSIPLSLATLRSSMTAATRLTFRAKSKSSTKSATSTMLALRQPLSDPIKIGRFIPIITMSLIRIFKTGKVRSINRHLTILISLKERRSIQEGLYRMEISREANSQLVMLTVALSAIRFSVHPRLWKSMRKKTTERSLIWPAMQDEIRS